MTAPTEALPPSETHATHDTPAYSASAAAAKDINARNSALEDINVPTSTEALLPSETHATHGSPASSASGHSPYNNGKQIHTNALLTLLLSNPPSSHIPASSQSQAGDFDPIFPLPAKHKPT
ncbi:hypothetical protein KSP40_PGU004043 [Platanthera guangdongensis]|uniref:Uncharacterized protein n=1 Tax=Platanthera guangdongensis TaxID=2320717 RepID=A0ABR2LJ66_9ASPA